MGIRVSTAVDDSAKQDSTDILLWLGGLVVAGVGLAWLVMAQPWQMLSSAAPAVELPVAVAPSEPATETEAIRAEQTESTELETALDNPLRMARLAFEAGMLVEPQDYSAWSLYQQVLDDEPDHPEALNGLTVVADTLVARGAVALEQGRVNDVRDIVARVLEMLPNHDGASALAGELGEPVAVASTRAPTVLTGPPSPAVVATAPTPVPIVEQAPAEAPAPEPPPVDPLTEMRSAFDAAMADNRLLTPADNNARAILESMIAVDETADAVSSARGLLVNEFLGRAADATEVLDVQAAETWIGQAENFARDTAAVTGARAELTVRRIQAESLKPLPASQLIITEYVAPRYPTRAASRSIEGWVDLEFVVTTEGATRDVVVTDASHETHFREQAAAAAESWLFEPREFLGQTIEQRAYTRIRFNLQ